MNIKYRTMLQRMKEKQISGKKRRNFQPWYLYIVRCHDKSLYTGIAKDVLKRVRMHNDKKGARYTRTRLPVKLVYTEKLSDRPEALIREWEVKSYSKKKKEILANSGQISL